MCEMDLLYAPTLLIFWNFVTIMVLIICDDDVLIWWGYIVLYCYVFYSYTVYLYILLCIDVYKYQKIYAFFGPVRNVSGAYFLELVAHIASVVHIAICATHSMLMAHMWYAPLKGKLCVAHIEMRHGHYFTNGMASVAHMICATHSSIS
jgi:hypothetical protein